jgi:hypothetical protein
MSTRFKEPVSSKVPPSEGFREAYILHLADTTLILSQRNSELISMDFWRDCFRELPEC